MKENRRKPGPKPDPTKVKATMVSVYLSERRKAALIKLSEIEDNGITAVLVTNAIERVYGEQLDNLEPTITLPNSYR